MKIVKNYKRACFLLVFILLVLASLFAPIMVYTQASSIKINKNTINLDIGETFQLKITGTKSKAKWSTNNKSIVTVSSDGVVTGIKNGFAEITAEINNKKLKCLVTVHKPQLERNSIILGLDGEFSLKICYLPIKYKDSKITWKSANTNIATVDENGVVTGKSFGNTKINVSFENYSFSCIVHVDPSKKNIMDAVDNFGYEYGEYENVISCILTNNSRIDLYFEYKLAFYDENDKIVSVSNKFQTNLFGNDSKVLTFEKTNKSYKSYKIIIESIFFNYNGLKSKLTEKNSVDVVVEKTPYSYVYYNDMKRIDDSIELFNLHVNNNSNDRLCVEAYVVYYKDKKIVAIDNFWNQTNIDVGSSILENPKSLFLNFEKISIPVYDDYKVVYNARSY
ncbi:MAG TPA: hypothetical protein DHW61_08475 [Lachnoclostridium phytofermentans]|uniref:BIG2 domain-containing protein n=1 Tax=Lachnoclostridium phytofermentans TaxID=66219 RepID=A0A3D2X635_9FIRM|nr:hypothetical protein [Lachnoclostridium phytofermentans]